MPPDLRPHSAAGPGKAREESHLKTELIGKEGHTVTLKVEAGPGDLAEHIERTYRDLGRKIKVKGFRSGRVPRQIIDSRLGREAVREEALKNAFPHLYATAVGESGIFPVADPEIEVLEKGTDDSVVFEVRVDVKPEVEVSDYRGVEVEKPDLEVTEEDLQRALDDARDRFATLEVVGSRPVENGDFVMLDYKVFADGVPLEGTSGSDVMVEVGSGDFIEGFDEQLVGASRGDILDIVVTFPPDYGERNLAGKPATFRTIVKEVKRKVLPPLDDELARQIGGFDTLEELKADLKKRLAELKSAMWERKVRERALKEVVDRTYIDLPESMIESAVQWEIDEMSRELEERGVTLDDYLRAAKGSMYELKNAFREKVIESLKSELVVEAIARAEGIEVSDEEALDFLREVSRELGGDPERAIDAARREELSGVKSRLRFRKVLGLLAGSAVVPGGGPALAEKADAAGEAPQESPETEAPVKGEDEAAAFTVESSGELKGGEDVGIAAVAPEVPGGACGGEEEESSGDEEPADTHSD